MTHMNPVVHFEMPYQNRDRAASFYEKAFGWKMQKLGPEMGNYVTAQTGETGEDGFPAKPGMINGGLFPKDESLPQPVPNVVIAVEDIDAHVQIIADAGGKVLGEPVDIPGIGRYVSFLDTEGNRVCVLQPSRM